MASVAACCRVLRPVVRGFLAARDYRAAKTRPASARALRDELLVAEVAPLHAENCGAYGRRKMHGVTSRRLSCEEPVTEEDIVVPETGDPSHDPDDHPEVESSLMPEDGAEQGAPRADDGAPGAAGPASGGLAHTGVTLPVLALILTVLLTLTGAVLGKLSGEIRLRIDG